MARSEDLFEKALTEAYEKTVEKMRSLKDCDASDPAYISAIAALAGASEKLRAYRKEMRDDRGAAPPAS